jgi:signal transduction histidine kinase
MLNSLALISILFTSVLNALLGIIVFVRNPKGDLNRLFLIVAFAIAMWTSSSLISDNTQDFELSKIASSLAFGFGFVGLFYITIFTSVLKKKLSHSYVTYGAFAVVSFIIFSSSLVYELVTIDEFETGILYIPYIASLFLLLIMSITNLNVALKKGTKSEKLQIKYILLGIGFMVVGGVLFNTLLPLSDPANADVYTKIGPLFSVAFVGLTGYAIAKHKLFDFRTVLVRSLTYIFTTLFVIVGYVVVAFFLKRFLLPDTQVETSQLIANIILTIILLITFPYIKRWFDRVSNRYFFRDAYDPQELIDRLNQTLVTNVNLEELLTKSALIMQEEMKASFTTFYIRETSYFDNRIIGAHRKAPEFESIEDIEKHAVKIHSKVFSTESVSEVENEKKLSQALKKNDVEVIARLTNTLDFEVKGIGYIFMGPKRSGSPYSNNDLKILEIIANELVIAIENVLRFEEIEQFNVTLQKKIDDATKELKTTNDKLRALDEAKDEFVSMASHQLRTPLTSIKGYISMVLDGDAGEITETQKTMLGQAFFSSQRMVYLISDLLNVSRLKTGKFIIESKPVYLPDVVESEIQQLVEGANAKNLTLSFTKPKEFSILNLDEMKIRQVIMNFTDNAIYYTPAGGKITVELKETAKSVEFIVRDTGIGVPKEQQHKLYTKFYRADNARKTRPDGTGLGLFMAKKVIIAQGGSMIFESKLGKGSTFGFSFPKEKLIVNDIDKK